jgi:hypothetical protein
VWLKIRERAQNVYSSVPMLSWTPYDIDVEGITDLDGSFLSVYNLPVDKSAPGCHALRQALHELTMLTTLRRTAVPVCAMHERWGGAPLTDS